ncbi:hypothetical protein R1flu_019771 [Riccia fluitans]|uniref:Uncharacterized protein n=1 Tax=Riccia fluitans TaxID=41844 RepID=A0ABD1ZJK9_9MARC
MVETVDINEKMSISSKGKTIRPLMQDKVLGRSPRQPHEDKSSLNDVNPTQDIEPIPGWAAIAIPYSYEELRLGFKRCYNADKEKFNIRDVFNDEFLNNIGREEKQAKSGNLKMKIRKIFLFYIGLERNDFPIEWNTVNLTM